jgi:calcineurin-like phosphoesterase family protein
MGPIFFTSDWHLFHENVIKYDERPFKDIHHMHQVLINNYNATVPVNGICYFLGDMGWFKGERAKEQMKEIISQLNGTRILILGNHDKGMTAMYECGFDVVLYTASLFIAGQIVTLSHCPLRGVFRESIEGMKGGREGDNWHGETKHKQFSVPDYGQFHLHGHIHSGPANKKDIRTNRQWDVGVAGNNYRPVSMKNIESWISKFQVLGFGFCLNILKENK